MTDNMGLGAIMPTNFQYNPNPYGDFDDLDLKIGRASCRERV